MITLNDIFAIIAETCKTINDHVFNNDKFYQVL